MSLTRDFRKTIQARALKDPYFRIGLLEESIYEHDYIFKNKK